MEMLEKNVNNRMLVEIVCLEDLVPEDHLLRKIEAAVDFSKIYEFVEDLYCEDNGRPSIDPVILFKMVLIQHLYGISKKKRLYLVVCPLQLGHPLIFLQLVHQDLNG